MDDQVMIEPITEYPQTTFSVDDINFDYYDDSESLHLELPGPLKIFDSPIAKRSVHSLTLESIKEEEKIPQTDNASENEIEKTRAKDMDDTTAKENEKMSTSMRIQNPSKNDLDLFKKTNTNCNNLNITHQVHRQSTNTNVNKNAIENIDEDENREDSEKPEDKNRTDLKSKYKTQSPFGSQKSTRSTFNSSLRSYSTQSASRNSSPRLHAQANSFKNNKKRQQSIPNPTFSGCIQPLNLRSEYRQDSILGQPGLGTLVVSNLNSAQNSATPTIIASIPYTSELDFNQYQTPKTSRNKMIESDIDYVYTYKSSNDMDDSHLSSPDFGIRDSQDSSILMSEVTCHTERTSDDVDAQAQTNTKSNVNINDAADDVIEAAETSEATLTIEKGMQVELNELATEPPKIQTTPTSIKKRLSGRLNPIKRSLSTRTAATLQQVDLYNCNICDLLKILLFLIIAILAIYLTFSPKYAWKIINFKNDTCIQFAYIDPDSCSTNKPYSCPFLTENAKRARQFCSDFGQKLGENWVLSTPRNEGEVDFLRNTTIHVDATTSTSRHDTYIWLGIKRDPQNYPNFHIASSNSRKSWENLEKMKIFFNYKWVGKRKIPWLESPGNDIRNGCVGLTNEYKFLNEKCYSRGVLKAFFCEIRRC